MGGGTEREIETEFGDNRKQVVTNSLQLSVDHVDSAVIQAN